jgi:3'(2'), 5'-bisphosphate nucleotidase
MASTAQPSSFACALADIAAKAGEIVMRHYAAKTVATRQKDDHSPVTAADEEAELFILGELKRIAPDAAVIAEEEVAAGHVRKIGGRFFLVDPLDGTKEFINRNGEFTVNIAEIQDGKPVRGVVYAPAKGRLWLGETPGGAWEVPMPPGATFACDASHAIHVRKAPADGMVAVASRSHRDSKTEEYLEHYKIKDFISAGSSLKFCLVAAGEADIYPRHGRTMEWDTAAGHAVLAAAGGSVTRIDGSPFFYGKSEEGYANPFFVAKGG